MAKTKVEVARVKVTGATIPIGNGNSQMFHEGDTIPLDQLPEVVLERLQENDPYTLETLELVEVDGEEAAKSQTTASGFDPGEHTVKEVLDHLPTLKAAEAKKIVAAEKKGKKRAGITSYKPPKEDETGGRQESGSSDDKPPIESYEQLDEAQIVALLEARKDDADFVGKVQAYEAANGGREAITGWEPAPPSDND